MSRAKVLAATVADKRQIDSFDYEAAAEQMTAISGAAFERAAADPTVLDLGADGIAPLERELVDEVFLAMVGQLWPEIVKAYWRGAHAGESVPKETPHFHALLDRPAADVAVLLDGLKMSGLRESLHSYAWGYASRVAMIARRIGALGGRGGAN